MAIHWHLFLHLFAIVFRKQRFPLICSIIQYDFHSIVCQWKSIQSIQCCLDSACSEKFIECPKNVCFKLGRKHKREMNQSFGFFSLFDEDMQIPGSEKHREERGCMNDLVNLVLPKKGNGSNLMDDNGDSCQKMDAATGGIILCKCTSNLCNISSKNSHLSYPVGIYIFFVILYQYSCVFRR